MKTSFVWLHVSKYLTPVFLLRWKKEINYRRRNITHKNLCCKLLTSSIKTCQFLWWTQVSLFLVKGVTKLQLLSPSANLRALFWFWFPLEIYLCRRTVIKLGLYQWFRDNFAFIILKMELSLIRDLAFNLLLYKSPWNLTFL